MSKKNENELNVRVFLEGEDLKKFHAVKEDLGLTVNSEVFRHLMVRAYNSIERKTKGDTPA